MPMRGRRSRASTTVLFTPETRRMSMREAHDRNIVSGGFERDPGQVEAVAALDSVYARLVREHTGRWPRLFRRRRGPTGLYLWGGVGRGKTYLMDLFFECLPFEAKLRMHFHRFMRRVHGDLQSLPRVANPLAHVAERMAEEARVLCFDEFFVSDIGDAMILGELLGALFDRGVTVVATSNVEPARLYENGLQRRRFLPAIERIEAHMKILHIVDGIDYRLRLLAAADTYLYPASDETEQRLAESFAALAPHAELDASIEVNGRRIPARGSGDGAAWFAFGDICDGPRSANDYIEVSREFHTVLVSGVPCFDAYSDDLARRFVALVDEFYDRGVNLVLSAACEVGGLYRGQRLKLEFERTRSRLLEMRSAEYLGRTHMP